MKPRIIVGCIAVAMLLCLVLGWCFIRRTDLYRVQWEFTGRIFARGLGSAEGTKVSAVSIFVEGVEEKQLFLFLGEAVLPIEDLDEDQLARAGWDHRIESNGDDVWSIGGSVLRSVHFRNGRSYLFFAEALLTLESDVQVAKYQSKLLKFPMLEDDLVMLFGRPIRRESNLVLPEHGP